ncbi:MAG: HDOD domain-containing protein, partial [Chloroflexi bacterium]|nr:HDOD domain-containing protein [Chloroflexota bacterium]
MRRFTLALDDFAFAPELAPLVDLVSIVKLDLPAVRLDERGVGARLALLRRRGKTLLAEKVEAASDFDRARRLGCELFQGYLWGRPEVRPGRQIPLSARSYLALLAAVADRHADTQEMKEIIRSDPALSQSLLRYIDAGLFRWSSRVDSVHRALVLLGRDEIRRWAAMLSLTGSFGGLPPELARSAAVRGRQLELLAAKLGAGER